MTKAAYTGKTMTPSQQSKVKETAEQLYRKHGLHKANFFAFHNMQLAENDDDFSFWLNVINSITALDVLGEAEVDYTQQM
jgi:hypothetical protein